MEKYVEQIVLSDALKSLYFTHQDTLLLETGDILTTNYHSPAIDEIKTHIETAKHDDYPELLGVPLQVKKFDAGSIEKLLERMSSRNGGAATRLDDQTLTVIGNDAKKMLQEAVSRGASDIHVELYQHETRILARIDGRMRPLLKTIPEYEYGNNLIGYLFNELGIDTDDDFYVNKPNNGRIEIDLMCPMRGDNGEHSVVQRQTRWRLSYIYANNKGGQATLRWLNKDTSIPPLEVLGWEAGHVSAMRNFLNSPAGACLLAGQVGSGKSTTIASAISEAIDSGRAINTLEDPVEFDIGVMQTSVLGGGDELNNLVKLLLRHDVDIEMHGEVRGHEGAMAVCRKAETGQLMFSTLHTSSAIGIAHTLNEQMHVPLALIAAPNLMKLWIYQTLVRTLCPHCALSLDEAQPHWSEHEQAQYQQWLELGVDTSLQRFKNPHGCMHCEAGEKGRTSLVEMVVLDDHDRQFILNKDYLGWTQALKAKGYKTVLDHANLKIRRGEIDLFSAAERVNGLFPTTSSVVYDSFFEEPGHKPDLLPDVTTPAEDVTEVIDSKLDELSEALDTKLEAISEALDSKLDEISDELDATPVIATDEQGDHLDVSSEPDDTVPHIAEGDIASLPDTLSDELTESAEEASQAETVEEVKEVAPQDVEVSSEELPEPESDTSCALASQGAELDLSTFNSQKPSQEDRPDKEAPC